MATKVLFLDRDGTIVAEPEDYQVDALEKVKFLPYAISSLARLAAAGFELVMVSNQDYMGTKKYPKEKFQVCHDMILQILSGEGIEFKEIFIDNHCPEDNHPNRKPNTGMLAPYLSKTDLDTDNSFVIGDRYTDAQLAANLGVRSITIKSPGSKDGDVQYDEGKSAAKLETKTFKDWPSIADYLLTMERSAEVVRETKETSISLLLNLDGNGDYTINTGIDFFNHMLELLSKHSGIDINLEANGDLEVDEHHTIEDVAIVLGQALNKALGNKAGIGRYGFTVPMDESLAFCAIDFSGRAHLQMKASWDKEYAGDFPTDMLKHFFESLCMNAAMNMHIDIKGENTHHKIEAAFKALAGCLKMAVKRQGSNLPSTKGIL